jgi:DnaJ-class molecular chaperone
MEKSGPRPHSEDSKKPPKRRLARRVMGRVMVCPVCGGTGEVSEEVNEYKVRAICLACDGLGESLPV